LAETEGGQTVALKHMVMPTHEHLKSGKREIEVLVRLFDCVANSTALAYHHYTNSLYDVSSIAF